MRYKHFFIRQISMYFNKLFPIRNTCLLIVLILVHNLYNTSQASLVLTASDILIMRWYN